MALTLRLVCGVGTGDIARAFLVSEPTMAARVTRAKKKITAAAIRTGCRTRTSGWTRC
ncbi:sigma factor-like helix-turn-helix DNA-binding protein [Nonomuraea deserti]|uniref:sigma factor-like helix-turn-helix DNA-binding protein n=1 Tax=Nonomuraea deserti TaxID=1848322 RepID=UPI001FE44B2A|nr:sigma factor-like helix-turn-helix DNA-binding protein [Nonomuraea deserti]